MNTPRIVIVGAGFAGLLVAKRLGKKLRGKAEVVLINDNEQFLFTPRLIDVLQDRNEGVPFRADLSALSKRHGYRFVHAKVQEIDRQAKHISVTHQNGDPETFEYTYAVVCPGASTHYYNTQGAKEFTIDLKSFESIVTIRERVKELFTRAAAAKDDGERRRLLSFAVIGGGAAGVEALFALKLHVEAYAEAHAAALKPFISFIMDQAAPQLLPGFPDALVDGAVTEIMRHHISLFVGEPVTRVTESGFETMHGRMVPAGLMLWCAGLIATPLKITPAPAADPAGFIVTDQSLQIDANMFAAGDAISFRDNQVIVPKNGQTARLMALNIEQNICRALNGQKPKHFHYSSKGTLMILGKMGFLDARVFVLKSRFIPALRDLFYKMVYTEIAT